MTVESLSNLVFNFQVFLGDVQDIHHNKMKYGLCDRCDAETDLHIIAAFTEVFRCYSLPVSAATSEECLTPTQMQDMLGLLNDICNTNYCADFILS